MKKTLLLSILFFTANLLMGQTTYYSEDFADGLPDGWTLTDQWEVGTSSTVSSQYFGVPESTTQVACFNDDAAGNNHTGGGDVITNTIDLSTVTGDIFFEMVSYFPNIDFQGNDETAKIYISTDGGTSWDLIHDADGGETAAFGVIFVDISSYAGSEIQLRMEYHDGIGWNYGWAIDEIRISDEITMIEHARSYAVHAGASTAMDEALEGIEYYHNGFVFNNGYETITSFDIVLTDGNETISQSFPSANIEYNKFDRFFIDKPIVVSGNKQWTVSIENVNGSTLADDNAENDAMTFDLNAMNDVHPDKAVFAEDATGTWCAWCPRGTVFIEEMSKRFGKHFVGVAVHNNDPMTLSEYDSEISTFPGFEGFPSVILQRSDIFNPKDIVNPSLDEMNIAPPARIVVGANMDGDNLETSIGLEFLNDVDAEFNVAIILTEDGVRGETGAWKQANAYAGGGNGAMGGYEWLPGGVPGSIVAYDHVGRALIGGFDGVDEIKGAFATGETAKYFFDTYSISSDINLDNVHVIGLLMDADGKVLNAASSSLKDALDRGLNLPINEEKLDENLAYVYPNPIDNIARIHMTLDQQEDVSITVFNALGQTIQKEYFGMKNGQFVLEHNMDNLTSGFYLLHIKAGDKFVNKNVYKID